METKNLLKKLNLDMDGRYKDNFYIIDLEDSNAYARAYTVLNNNAVNTEYPSFLNNSNKTTVKVTNYFEIEDNNVTYNIFLIANFDTDEYYIKIGEK